MIQETYFTEEDLIRIGKNQKNLRNIYDEQQRVKKLEKNRSEKTKAANKLSNDTRKLQKDLFNSSKSADITTSLATGVTNITEN